MEAMDLRLAGKVAVVTGARKGIGLAVTRALVGEGVSVLAAARDLTEDLSQLTTQGRVHPVRVDLGTPDGPARLIDETVVAYGGLDVLVNNVGALRPRTGGFLSLTDDDWLWALTINFLAAVRTTRAALPYLLDRATTTIVSTCSVNAVLPDPLVIDYSAAKAALLNFSKSLSKEVAPEASASTRSVRGRSPPRCGSARPASPRPSPAPAAAKPGMLPNRPPMTR